MGELSVCHFMNIFYSMVANFACYAYEHPLVTLLLSFFVALVLIGNVHLTKLLCQSEQSQVVYDYGSERGPHAWPVTGPYQSPININTALVNIMPIREHLMWNHYNDLPLKVTMENTGQTVKAQYKGNAPTISGADLLQSYTFKSLCFHWSDWNTGGSEHSIDSQMYAMEIQATHKTGQILSCTQTHDSLILAYLFEISAHNPYLDPITLNLHRIRKANTVIDIPPFPLAWLCYPFKNGFYSYGGSETTPPCAEKIEWFICSEPMTISEKQLMEFRSLLSTDGSSRIIRNSRPVQNLNNNRIVNFNQYEASSSSHSNTSFNCDALNDSEVYENDDD